MVTNTVGVGSGRRESETPLWLYEVRVDQSNTEEVGDTSRIMRKVLTVKRNRGGQVQNGRDGPS